MRSDDVDTKLKEELSVTPGPGQPVAFVDTIPLRADMDILATLPDTTDDAGDKPSQMVAQVREVLDLIGSRIESGKPFSDGSGNGQKMLDLWTPLAVTRRARRFCRCLWAGVSDLHPGAVLKPHAAGIPDEPGPV